MRLLRIGKSSGREPGQKSGAWHLQLLDPKLQGALRFYVFQCGLATLALTAILVLEDLLASTRDSAELVIVAAIGSTAFVLFIMPHSMPARARNTLGGHLVGLLVGSVVAVLVAATGTDDGTTTVNLLFALQAGAAVGLTLFAMAATSTEHPPAAGTALAMVAGGFNWGAVFFLVTSVLVLYFIYLIFRPRMRNLY